MPDDKDQKDHKDDLGDQKIKVGEKEYTAQDVESLLSQAKSATEKGKQVSAILEACNRYEMEPEEFLKQAVGGFNVLGNLIEEGIIDAEGNIKQTPKKKESGDSRDDLDDILNLKKKETDLGGTDKMEALINKALEPFTKELKEGLDGVKEVQTNMIRRQYQTDIISKYPNLDAEDVSKIFGAAMQDRSKSIWDIAKTASEAKVARDETKYRAFCEEHGLDYEQLKKSKKDENSLDEKGPEGGAAALAEGKTITFRSRGVNSEKAVSPLDLTKAYFKKVDSGG